MEKHVTNFILSYQTSDYCSYWVDSSVILSGDSIESVYERLSELVQKQISLHNIKNDDELRNRNLKIGSTEIPLIEFGYFNNNVFDFNASLDDLEFYANNNCTNI